MKYLQVKLDNFCNWFTWARITNFVLIFLVVKLISELLVYRTHLLTDFMSLFFYVGGLVCGIALTLSTDRRKTNLYSTNNSRKKKL